MRSVGESEKQRTKRKLASVAMNVLGCSLKGGLENPCLAEGVSLKSRRPGAGLFSVWRERVRGAPGSPVRSEQRVPGRWAHVGVSARVREPG